MNLILNLAKDSTIDLDEFNQVFKNNFERTKELLMDNSNILKDTINIRKWDSEIYDILEKLLEKGLISYKIENNIKTFRATTPESLYAKFHEKEEQLDKEKTELKSFITSLKQIPLKENNCLGNTL